MNSAKLMYRIQGLPNVKDVQLHSVRDARFVDKGPTYEWEIRAVVTDPKKGDGLRRLRASNDNLDLALADLYFQITFPEYGGDLFQ